LTLATLCSRIGVHLTYFGTGCVFNDDPESDQKKKYTEEDKPNFFNSAYGITKGHTDQIMQMFGDIVLNVRVRLVLSSDAGNSSRNLINKLLSFDKIINIENSVTVLDEMLPALYTLACTKKTGTMNMTNPGTISHNEIMELYKQYVDPKVTWENFSVSAQNEILACERSNCEMDSSKLKKLCPEISTAKEAVAQAMKLMGEQKKMIQSN